MGGSTKRADAVIYRKKHDLPYIILEFKKSSRTDGVKQLQSYCNATGSPISIWSNGIDMAVLKRIDPNQFVFISDIPRSDQTLYDVLSEKWTIDKLTQENRLSKGTSFKELIQNLENLVLAAAGVDSFDIVFKLIYAKLYDEYAAKHHADRKKIVEFRRYDREDDVLFDVVDKLFDQAKSKWQGVFTQDDKIDLTPSHLTTCVSALENIKLFNSNLYVIDEAFEYLVSKVAKGNKGQYFTPRHVIDMCIKMLDPQKSEYVIDTAAGSCGFTVHTLFHVFNTNGKFSIQDPSQEQIDYSSEKIYGLDFDEKSVKIAKALNLIAGDGKTNVYNANTLDPRIWNEQTRYGLRKRLKKFRSIDEKKYNEENFKYFNFDAVMTNPPFAGNIEQPSVLKNYHLAKKKNKIRRSVSRHILFIERNLDFLKDGGRMAIILPEGFFSNTSTKYLRDFVQDKCRILAVVSLSVNTFKPHTATKTSVLFVQKWDAKICKKTNDYKIFMAISENSGKDNRGNLIYEKDVDGNIILDEFGHPKIAHDLSKIVQEFNSFRRKEKLVFNQ